MKRLLTAVLVLTLLNGASAMAQPGNPNRPNTTITTGTVIIRAATGRIVTIRAAMTGAAMTGIITARTATAWAPTTISGTIKATVRPPRVGHAETVCLNSIGKINMS